MSHSTIMVMIVPPILLPVHVDIVRKIVRPARPGKMIQLDDAQVLTISFRGILSR